MNAMNRLAKLPDPVYTPILNVHDDLSFYLEEDRLDERLEVIIDQMLQIDFDFINVPLGVEVSIGSDWAHLEEIGKFDSYSWLKQPQKMLVIK